MTRSRRKTLLTAASMLIGLGLTPVSWAAGREDCVRWSSEKEGMRCFECMKRVWTGHEWRLQNTCPPRAPYNFFSR